MGIKFSGIILATLAIALVTACDAQAASPSPTAPIAVQATAIPPTAILPAQLPSPSPVQPSVAPTIAPPLAAPTRAPTISAPVFSPTLSTPGTTQAPRFTRPTEITNPFYPVSLIGQSISLGTEGAKPFRTEVTLLPGTTLVTWNGQQTEVRVSQYVAYSDSRLVEVAYDSFAQSDDGSVYYFGEDVTNYADGKVVDHNGTWSAGKDGAPPSMIMPAHPQVGQVFNPENLPGVAYETDEILSLTEKTTTPAGPINNGVLIKELLMDGSIEHKVNAANFGIVESRATDEQVNLILLNRTDAKPGIVPETLSTMEVQAEDIIDVVPSGNWQKATADVAVITKAWQAYEVQAAKDKVPQPFLDASSGALDDLQKADTAKDARLTMQAANDLSAALVDLYTFYRPATPTDLTWLDVLERQIVLEVSDNDFVAAADSLAKTNVVWARLKPMILAHKGAAVASQFDDSLRTQQSALNNKNGAALTVEAKKSLALVDALESLF